ncbi:MAG TPA: Uma2 family endonuclease [Thermoanaerobaculia bacterium]|nr:Uma2 family endonuclease [Thermoanaerobaculia bacterium]
MSQPAVAALAPLPFELVYSDGEPLESDWHARQIHLLQDLIPEAMAEQGRTDYFVGGNMFVYYSREQAREVWEEVTKRRQKRTARGPDVFWVEGIDPDREREAWVAWEEDGRLPDVIFELLSPKTEETDRTTKKQIYQDIFRTAEYFLCDPRKKTLEGFRLIGGVYQPIAPDAQGRLPSERLGVTVTFWRGLAKTKVRDWVRLFRPDGTLVPTPEEREEAERRRADAERQRAEAEHRRAEAAEQRADAAEAEIARLRALLGEQGRG